MHQDTKSLNPTRAKSKLAKRASEVYLERGSNPQKLQFAMKLALLTRHTVEDTADIAEDTFELFLEHPIVHNPGNISQSEPFLVFWGFFLGGGCHESTQMTHDMASLSLSARRWNNWDSSKPENTESQDCNTLESKSRRNKARVRWSSYVDTPSLQTKGT